MVLLSGLYAVPVLSRVDLLVPECQSLVYQWLASHLEQMDIIDACRTDDRTAISRLKKQHLELSGFALISCRLGSKQDRRIVDWLCEPSRASLITSLAAREIDAFSQYGMGLAWLAENGRRAEVLNLVERSPVFAANDPSEWSLPKFLDTSYVLTILGLKPEIEAAKCSEYIINASNNICFLSEKKLYFLTHILFFQFGFGEAHWNRPTISVKPCLYEKLIISCLARNNLDGAMEVVLAQLISGSELTKLGRTIIVAKIAKLINFGSLDVFFWGEPQRDYKKQFHPMIVAGILLAVLEVRSQYWDADFSSIDARGLESCAALGGVARALGQHELEKAQAGLALVDGEATCRLIGPETRESIASDFDGLADLLASGDGDGAGFYVPEVLSGIPVDPKGRTVSQDWLNDRPWRSKLVIEV